jgi:hypothetical protein
MAQQLGYEPSERGELMDEDGFMYKSRPISDLHEPVLTGFDEDIDYIVTKGTLSR